MEMTIIKALIIIKKEWLQKAILLQLRNELYDLSDKSRND